MYEITKQVEFLMPFFKNKTDGFFVEIGANDGVNISNSYHLEKIGWDGVCIEPIPEIYDMLIKNRKCECYNVAITEEEKEYEFLHVKGKRHPHIYIDMLSGIVDYYDERHKQRIDSEVAKYKGDKVYFKVEGKKFNNLIQRTNIDYVSIDTEGNELSIIKSIDFGKYNIFSFSIENNYNDPELIKFMLSKGYEHVSDINPDNIFIKNYNSK